MKTSNITDAQRDRIVGLVKTMEMRTADVAKAVQCSDATVNRVIQYYDAAKESGVDGICELASRSSSSYKDLARWALSRAGITPTERDLLRVAASVKRTDAVPPNVEVVVKEEPNDTVAFARLVQQMEILANQNKVIIETLKSGFESVADAITALAGDIKDNTNLNSDLLCERLKEQTDILNGIKMNTRKRGL